MRRLLAPIALAAAVLSVWASPAAATPVKCAASDVTPGDRVFPEGNQSVAFVRFDEFQCGMKLLEQIYPDLLQITNIGTSKAGHPIFNVLMTDEKVTSKKRKLLVVNSIHGNEPGGREGAVRNIEDMVDPRFLANEPWVQKVLDEFVIHWLFINPDGWVAGDLAGTMGAGFMATRGNDSGRDLNRQFPVKGWIDVNNATLAEPEGNVAIAALFKDEPNDWYLGTDNHGQGPDEYAAAGLQIVGEFDFQKSETLARFADGINGEMANYDVLGQMQQLGQATNQDAGAYHWGTLYDMLGYSASGSLIDYYNTASGNAGTGYATELTVGAEVNWATFPSGLAQVWIDSIRAINYTMFKQAIDPKRFTYEVGGRAAYVFDPDVIRHDDANGAGPGGGGDIPQRPYSVSRMKFFTDLNKYASRPLDAVRVADVTSGEVDIRVFDSIVLANDAMPERADEDRWYARLKEWIEAGGNLVVTDAAAPALAKLGLVGAAKITSANHYVGFVDFGDRTHPLNANLRGVARQTYDTVPIGYQFGGEDSAPNWKVEQAAWEARGGYTAGTNGSGQTIYGEMPVGKGRVRFLGALLPDPTEDFYHPYGLQNYAVTYTGYTLMQNMLKHSNPSRIDPVAPSPGSTCRARKPFTVRVKLPRKARAKSLRLRVNGKRVKRLTRRRRAVVVRIRARHLRGARVSVRLTGRARGKAFRRGATYRLCP